MKVSKPEVTTYNVDYNVGINVSYGRKSVHVHKCISPSLFSIIN